MGKIDKIPEKRKQYGLSMLMNRKCTLMSGNAGKAEERKEDNEDEHDEYTVDEPGERKCAILMMMNLIV